jgi:hypothetical protein
VDIIIIHVSVPRKIFHFFISKFAFAHWFLTLTANTCIYIWKLYVKWKSAPKLHHIRNGTCACSKFCTLNNKQCPVHMHPLAVPWLRQLVAGLSLQRPRFISGSVHIGFAVHKVALGQIFLQVLCFFLHQYHSAMALHAHISPGGEQYACWWLQFREIISPHRHEQQ